MITIARAAVDEVRGATRASDLHGALRDALRLEHATIPLYLGAYLSIRPGTNTVVADLLRSVVVEEMLHFTIVANLITALGGRARIDAADMVPDYTQPLPLGGPGGLRARLAPVSREQCALFAEIEQPEDPLARDPVGDVATIGEFYAAVADSVRALPGSAFAAPSAPPVVPSWFPAGEITPITDAESAVRALDLIVRQGEGTTSSPFEHDGDLAHYYRFRQIVEGHALVADPAAPEGFSYTGAEIRLDAAGVYPLITDPSPDHYADDALARRLVDQFDECYRRLLVALDRTFAGTPEALDAAIGVMYELRLMAIAMAETPVTGGGLPPGTGVTPLWRYPG